MLMLSIFSRWDAEAERRLRSLDGHSARVGALSWNQHWLSSGGRDSQIIQHDVRSRNHVVSTYVGHTQEVSILLILTRAGTLFTPICQQLTTFRHLTRSVD